jgi:hypothetical protein
MQVRSRVRAVWREVQPSHDFGNYRLVAEDAAVGQQKKAVRIAVVAHSPARVLFVFVEWD